MVNQKLGQGFLNVEEGTSQIVIDAKAAEDAAKLFDFEGRDLAIHIDYDFKVDTPMNFVIIDPVLFGTTAFIQVIDVATANDGEDFVTVEGFADQTFDKILTPEANKVVSEDIVEKTLAPSSYSYQGLGVFTFPVRIARKLRVTLFMKDPVSDIYERLHVITQEQTTTTVKKKSKKKGLF